VGVLNVVNFVICGHACFLMVSEYDFGTQSIAGSVPAGNSIKNQ
jgi:hypothetical protein